MRINSKAKDALSKIGIALAVVIIIVVAVYSDYAAKMESQIQLKSRYTFTVCIDESGNIVEQRDESIAVDAEKQKPFSLDIGTIGDIWINEFLNQYTQKFLGGTKSLRKIQIEETEVLDKEANTVLISFSAKPLDSTTEYFSSWEGIIDDGRMRCEWVVKFNIDNHYDGTATIYVDSMLTPEDYGIYQYNESMKEEGDGNQSQDESESLTGYVIRDSALYITYDGGESYKSVPVAYENLLVMEDDATTLKEGAYMISTTKTAIMYGGSSESGEDVPVTLLYSNNMGEDWITCEIDKIYTADYMYVEFFDENVGMIFIGYDRNELTESSCIYSTFDGGLTWNVVGSGPATGIIKGVKFIDEKTGFICYKHVDGMDSNMYLTRDGGKTFSKIIFEAQKLDGITDLKWEQVYKEAQVPKYNKNGILTVNITQGELQLLNNGKTVARYESSDKGSTWKYIGQFELSE